MSSAGSETHAGGDYPRLPERVPQGVLHVGAYRVSFACSEAELVAIQQLRFEVFNRECGEGLESSWATGRDDDRFDAYCHHVMVLHERDGLVGTYRLMDDQLAQLAGGFYSEGEFDLARLPEEVRFEGVEIGRACVHAAHRNGRVIASLFRGLARYLSVHRKRYLFGCCSLPTTDPAAAWATHRWFAEMGHLHEVHRFAVLPELTCHGGSAHRGPLELTPLFAAYLLHGAKVCSKPAIDRAFEVIDFFVLFDVENLEERRRRRFYVDGRWSDS